MNLETMIGAEKLKNIYGITGNIPDPIVKFLAYSDTLMREAYVKDSTTIYLNAHLQKREWVSSNKAILSRALGKLFYGVENCHKILIKSSWA